MSEAQSPTGTLNLNVELTAKDVDLLHKIVVRAQDEPQGTHRSSLLTAYQNVLQDRNLDPTQDDVFFWLLLELLKPTVEGHTLLEKFDHVMRNRGIEVVFEDDASTQESTYSRVDQPAIRDKPVQPRRMSEVSRQSSQDIADLHLDTDNSGVDASRLDKFIDDPPAHVARLEQIAEVHNRKTLLILALGAWRDETAAIRRLRDLRMMEQYADHVYERRLRYKVMSHWYNLQRQIVSNDSAADDFYLHYKNSSALSKLRDTARVNRIQAMENVRLQGLGLYKLTMASRESALSRKLDNKLKRQCFSALLISLRSTMQHQHELEGHFANTHENFERRKMRAVFYTMYHASHQAHQNYNSSADQYDTKLKATAMVKWTNKMQHLRYASTATEDVRKTFLLRDCICKLRDDVQAKNERRTQILAIWKDFVREKQERRVALAQRTLTAWRKFVQKSKDTQYQTVYAKFRFQYKKRLVGECLQKITTRARTVASMQQTAVDHYNARIDVQTTKQAHEHLRHWYKLAHARKQQSETAAEFARKQTLDKAWKAMTDKQRQVKHLELVGESFLDLHAQAVSRRCLKIMSRKAFEIRCRQQDADAFTARHERQMLRGRWDEWRRKVAENRGEGPLILPPATPAQRRADQLNRLASTTPLFAPRTSFAARLRGDVRPVEGIEEDDEG